MALFATPSDLTHLHERTFCGGPASRVRRAVAATTVPREATDSRALQSRRFGLAAALSSISWVGLRRRSLAAEPKLPPPPDGLCADCLGVVDGLLKPCSGNLTFCVSSQDDRPEVFENPWQLPTDIIPRPGRELEVDVVKACRDLKRAIAAEGGRIVREAEEGRYLRAEFVVSSLFDTDADDYEFYFTPGDSVLQFRAERRSHNSDFGENRRRLEAIRIRLGWELVPVIRNRKRVFIFGESPFDQFGPSMYEQIRPGAEPTAEEAMSLLKRGMDAKPGLPFFCDPKEQICT